MVSTGLLQDDAVHLKCFFPKAEASYESLVAELRQRETLEGINKTYWQHSNTSVTRVRHMADLTSYPIHQHVVRTMADQLHVRVEGWWVNHYASGSGVKNMHRDGWGRDRGVNITLGASFGSARTLHFEATNRSVNPQHLDCVQENGDVFAFGARANQLYKHGIPAEPDSGPRISVIVMGYAPSDWFSKIPPVLFATLSSQSEGPNSKPTTYYTTSKGQQRRRWQATRGEQNVDDTDQLAMFTRGKRWARRVANHDSDPGNPNVPAKFTDTASPIDALDRVCLIWLRDDLRLSDNPALHAAISANFSAIIPIFIHDTEDPCPWPVRGAALWWKGESLQKFDTSLRTHCASQLVMRCGLICTELMDVALAVKATHVFFNRMVEPWYRQRDLDVEAQLTKAGMIVQTFKAILLQEPWEGSPPKLPTTDLTESNSICWHEVSPGKLKIEDAPEPKSIEAQESSHLNLTDVVSIINADRLLSNPNPCAQLLTALGEDSQTIKDHRRRDPDHFLVYQDIEAGAYNAQPLSSVKGCQFPAPLVWPSSLDVADLGYLCTNGKGFPSEGMPQSAHIFGGQSVDWAAGMKTFWCPGEDAALQRLHTFMKTIETHSRPNRHRGDKPNTSLLSPHLRFGEISVRKCYFEALKAPPHLRHGFIRRLLWRDLSYAELYRWPDMPETSQRMQYEEQAWSGTSLELRKWQRGRTGFPLVDAAMRQLWREGYINNYLRHVVAGFLIDYLDISWKHGFQWFDYTLVDSDAAINARLWQQGGHSGISQWNFVLHPVYAAKNADPTGAYVRQWVPELAGVSTEFIHRPWESPTELFSASVKLGATYPVRMLMDIEAARKRHLRAVIKVRQDHPNVISPDGTEYLLLQDGSRVLLRTRDDIRKDTDELIVKQTPDDTLHGRGRLQRRRPEDSILELEVSRGRLQSDGAARWHIL